MNLDRAVQVLTQNEALSPTSRLLEMADESTSMMMYDFSESHND